MCLQIVGVLPSENQDMDVIREENASVYHNDPIRESSEDRGDPESRGTMVDEELPSQLVTPYDETDEDENHDRHTILDLIDLDDSSLLPESRTSIEGILSAASVRGRAGGLEIDGADMSMLEALERVVATRTNPTSREAAAFLREANRRSSFRLSDGSGEGVSEGGAESSGEDGEESRYKSMHDWAQGPGARHASPICYEKGYREFMISMLPALQVLDNIAILENDRGKARSVYEERFEPMANKRKMKESVLQVLR